MRFRSLAMSAMWVGLFVTTVMALRAADDKAKVKNAAAVPPSPGTIKFTTAPAPVQKTFNSETKNARIELLGKSADGTFYMAVVGIGTNDYKLAVGKDGLLWEKVLEPAHAELKVTEIPAVIQKTLNDEAKGAKIVTIERVVAGKRADFIIDLTLQKVEYQLIISEDGTLISKVMDNGDGPEDAGAAKPNEKPADAPPKRK